MHIIGSDSNLIDGFFDVVSPRYAIISAGIHRNWNFPSEKVINALNFVKRVPTVEIFVTKDVGTIIIESDGKELKRPRFIDYKFDGNI